MSDMQDKGFSRISRKKVFIYGAVFFCAVFSLFFLFGGNSIHSFGAKMISVAEESFGMHEEEIGFFPLHSGKESDEVNVLPYSLEECAFDTLDIPARKSVILNEIAWMGNASGADSEWIELKNISGSEVNLGGWMIIDKDEQIKMRIKTFSLPPQKFFLAMRKNDVTSIKGDEVYEGSLRNEKEGLRLFNSSCGLEDEIIAEKWPAGDNKTKKTMERNANDFGWHTSVFPDGTPKKENSKSQISSSKQIQNQKTENEQMQKTEDSTTIITITTTTVNNPTSTEIIPTSLPTKIEVEKDMKGAVLISEVCAGTEENAKYEFIELYNRSSQAIDLTGWTIKKRTSTGNETSLVSAVRLEGKVISPHSYFVIGNEGGYKSSADAYWAQSYTLAYSNNAVVLYKDGEKIDEAIWEDIPKGMSIKRVSWDSDVFSISSPTPGN